MSCQVAASKNWNIFRIDHYTAFLQGESYYVNHGVACQLPPGTTRASVFEDEQDTPASTRN